MYLHRCAWHFMVVREASLGSKAAREYRYFESVVRLRREAFDLIRLARLLARTTPFMERTATNDRDMSALTLPVIKHGTLLCLFGCAIQAKYEPYDPRKTKRRHCVSAVQGCLMLTVTSYELRYE